MGLTGVLDQQDVPLAKAAQETICQCVETQYVGEKNSPCLRTDLREHLVFIHPQGPWIDINENRGETRSQHRGNV